MQFISLTICRLEEPTFAEEKTQDLPAKPAKGLDGCLRIALLDRG